MKFTPVKQKIAIATLAVLFTGAVAVFVDYTNHQRPLKYADLTMDQKAEYYHINQQLAQIDRESEQEGIDIYNHFKATGEIRPKTKFTMFNPDYQHLLALKQELFNPPSRKTEGFGYAVLKFLGFKK